MSDIKRWRKSNKGYFTPGGDSVWECPNCGAEHVYGIETQEGYSKYCERCGIRLYYPWEKEDDICNTEK